MENQNFKQVYENQVKLINDWMTSQKKFKELALQFSEKKN